VDERAVRKLLALSHFSDSSTVRALEHYRVGTWRLLGYERGDRAIACIGFEELLDRSVVIHSLAVDPAHRRHCLGRRLIAELRARFPGSTLVAETDADAVGFYARCGFAIESLGERFPGVERFRCTRVAAGTASA